MLYIHRISETTSVSTVTPEYISEGQAHVLQDKALPHYVTILRIHGPFLFGTTEQLAQETADLNRLAQVVILRLRNMTAIDATGLHALESLAKRLERVGKTLVLCGARRQPEEFLRKSGFSEHIGVKNVQPHVQAALLRAAEINADFGGTGAEVAREMERTSI